MERATHVWFHFVRTVHIVNIFMYFMSCSLNCFFDPTNHKIHSLSFLYIDLSCLILPCTYCKYLSLLMSVPQNCSFRSLNPQNSQFEDLIDWLTLSSFFVWLYLVHTVNTFLYIYVFSSQNLSFSTTQYSKFTIWVFNTFFSFYNVTCSSIIIQLFVSLCTSNKKWK